MSVVLKIVWVLQNITLTTAPIVTLIYWTSIYDGEKKFSEIAGRMAATTLII